MTTVRRRRDLLGTIAGAVGLGLFWTLFPDLAGPLLMGLGGVAALRRP
jgi:hypothetical protein